MEAILSHAVTLALEISFYQQLFFSYIYNPYKKKNIKKKIQIGTLMCDLAVTPCSYVPKNS